MIPQNPPKTNTYEAEQINQAAHGRWRQVHEQLGVDPSVMDGKHHPCPLCGGTDRFRYDDQEGRGTSYCNQCGGRGRAGGAMDGLELAHRLCGGTFPGTLQRVAEILGLTAGIRSLAMPDRRVYREPPPAKQSHDAATWLRKLIQGLRQDDGTVGRYLDQRGLPGINGAALYLHPKCWHSATRQTHPAMIGLITNLDGHCVGAHRTYLDQRTNGKADVVPNKMLTPAITPDAYRGTCIHLFDHQSDELSLAEGIETALAVYAMTGSAVWAACSASMLAQVEIPAHIVRVNIWADNDLNNAGQDAARQAAQRLSTFGHHVTVHIPPRPGDDWLDVLIRAQEVSA